MSATTRHILAAPAWAYANGPRHIGHVSGFGLPCDMFSRYQRMSGNQVLMVSGTDEHGTPIQVQAEKEGATPRELADRYNQVIAEDLAGLDMSYDLFTRTTTRNHYSVVQDLFRGLYDNGYIFPRKAIGAISPSTTGSSQPLPLGFSHAHHPVGSGLALCERPSSYRACLRLRAAL